MGNVVGRRRYWLFIRRSALFCFGCTAAHHDIAIIFCTAARHRNITDIGNRITGDVRRDRKLSEFDVEATTRQVSKNNLLCKKRTFIERKNGALVTKTR